MPAALDDVDALQRAGDAHAGGLVAGADVAALDLDVAAAVAVVDDFDLDLAEAEHAVGEVVAEVAGLAVIVWGLLVGEVYGVGEGGGDNADDTGAGFFQFLLLLVR